MALSHSSLLQRQQRNLAVCNLAQIKIGMVFVFGQQLCQAQDFTFCRWLEKHLDQDCSTCCQVCYSVW